MNFPKPRIYNKGLSSDFIIRIESGHGQSVKGKIEHMQTGQIHSFNDFLELLILIDNRLNEQGCPQSDTELRSFID